MFNIKEEIALRLFFILDIFAWRFIPRADIMRVAWGLVDECAVPKRLSELAERKEIVEIRSTADYMSHRRISDFLGGNVYPAEIDTVIGFKTDAFSVADRVGRSLDSVLTQNRMLTLLATKAEEGEIYALSVLGILQCEGMIAARDTASGMAKLKKAAQWCDVMGALAWVKYGPRERGRDDALSTLKSILTGSPYYPLYQVMEKHYSSRPVKADECVYLLKKAFAIEKCNAAKFMKPYARLIYGRALCLKDKEKALFSADNSEFASICTLPLKLEKRSISVSKEAFSAFPLRRKAEADKIYRSLINSDLSDRESYLPLCIVSDSAVIRSMYVKLIRSALTDVNVDVINAEDLREGDFSRAKTYYAIRNLDEDRANMLLYVLAGDIAEGEIESIKLDMKSEQRRKFILIQPSVTLDLSSVVPLCIADKRNAQLLKGSVRLVEIKDLADNEKPAIYETIASEKCREFGIEGCSIESAAMAKLIEHSPDDAERIISDALSDLRAKGISAKITVKAISPYVSVDNDTYGFLKKLNKEENRYGY